MGELGLTGAPLPESVGGAGFSYLGWSLVMEELGAADMATAVTLSVHILSQYPVVTWGTDEQRARWLGPMVAGEALGAFALTEPHAGSDAARDPDPRRAGRAGRRARGLPPDRHEDLDHERARGGSLPRVRRRSTRRPARRGSPRSSSRRGWPGFTFGAHEKKMGIRACPAAELVFEDCFVPVGEPARRGGRGLQDRAVGAGRGADLDRGGVRRAGPLGAGAGGRVSRPAQGVRGAACASSRACGSCVAEMARDVEAARALTRQAAAMKDRGEPIGVASSLAKWTASDTAMKVATDAVQLFGASGYSRETGIERLMRDAKGAQIYEGTNQIHRLIVADDVLG